MAPVWLVLWAVLLALAWLIPNHFLPWVAFHSDAYVALITLIGAGAAVCRVRASVQWHVVSCVMAALVGLPWLHHVAGLIPFTGQAWISSTYLLGFLLSLLIGARWESASPMQLAHALFLAIGLAAVVSVGLQLGTWFNVIDTDIDNIWSIGLTTDRPYANLGQPNHLATLLLWGLIACLWARLTGVVGSISAVFIAAFLLFGLALTQSRMGYLSLTALLLAFWWWRAFWPSKRMPWFATVLYLYFLLCPALIAWLNTSLMQGQDESFVRVLKQGELRLGAWQLFTHALSERPWFGFGWTNVGSAQLAVANQFPSLASTFGSSHNLFLDLMLWTGLPIGLLISAFLVRWFWLALRSIERPEEAALFMLLGVAGIHAMLEYPLQYAYFLLPTGLVMGVLNARLKSRVIFTSPRWVLRGMWLAAALALGITVRDYLRVESSYNIVRLEMARVQMDKLVLRQAPDVWVLDQFHELIRFARFKPVAAMTATELDWMRTITTSFPSTSSFFKLATALALNNRPQEASTWLDKMCRVVDEQQCANVQAVWATEAQKQPELALVVWPK